MGHCYGNRAQYERNRTFRYLVYVAGRKANAAKLPSEGLRLNASKSESYPECAMILSVLDTLCGKCIYRIERFRRPVWCNAMLTDHNLFFYYMRNNGSCL